MDEKKPLPKLPYGMGSYDYYNGRIRYRKTGRVGNKTKRLVVTGDTIKEVNELMQKTEAEFVKETNKKVKLSHTKMFQDALREWIETYKKTTLKPKSYGRYIGTFEVHIEGSSLGVLQEASVEPADIQNFLYNLRSAHNGKLLSYSSIKKIYEMLCQYYRYKYAQSPNDNPMIRVQRPTSTSPMVSSEKRIKNELTILDDEEMERFTRVAYEEPHYGNNSSRHCLGLAFMMYTFLRLGEARALRWRDIDLEAQTIRVTSQISDIKDEDLGKYVQIESAPKKNSLRSFKIPMVAVDIAREYKKRLGIQNDDLRFFCMWEQRDPDDPSNAISDSGIRQIMNAMFKRAGITKHLTVHDLRHTGISYLLRHKVPVEIVSRMAGHSSINITYDVYYQIIQSQKEDAIDKLNADTYIDYTK